MSNILGTNISSPIVPFTTSDTYPTHYAIYGEGGWKSVNARSDRDAIPAARLENGSVVYVVADALAYVYNGSSWSPLVTSTFYSNTSDASAMTRSDVALTPASISPLISSVQTNISSIQSTTVSAGNGLSGGGNLSSNITLTAATASSDDANAATRTDVLLTPESINVIVDDLYSSIIMNAVGLIQLQTMFVNRLAFQ